MSTFWYLAKLFACLTFAHVIWKRVDRLPAQKKTDEITRLHVSFVFGILFTLVIITGIARGAT